MATQVELKQVKTNLAWTSEDGFSYLYHGDSFDIMASLPAESVDCIWTDPPYNLSNDGITCVNGRMVTVNKGEWDRSQGIENDHEFNKAWLASCYRLLKPTGTIWVTGTMHVYPSVGFAMQQLGFRILNDIIWEKPAPPPNLGCRCFTHSTELILWATKARKGKERYTFNYETMKAENGNKQMKNVWRISVPGKKEKCYGKHPTQKPLALISRCLRASTNPGDLVFDPFAGSSTTGVAALAMSRKFIGCELDKTHIELSINRLTNPGKIEEPPAVPKQGNLWKD
ncbi:MAG: site-specific DNA-methyltransferase [Cyanobacteriota bacterium]|nr:site-specific DNA-methyltransferase [Cyanobacteriota bacterium]